MNREQLKIFEDLCGRAEKARKILQEKDNGNWGMLDTTEVRKILALNQPPQLEGLREEFNIQFPSVCEVIYEYEHIKQVNNINYDIFNWFAQRITLSESMEPDGYIVGIHFCKTIEEAFGMGKSIVPAPVYFSPVASRMAQGDGWIDEILKELQRAETKHPAWPQDVVYAVAILQEESGETMRAAVQYTMEGGNISEVKKEAIETAAMCLRLLKNLPAPKKEESK